MAKSAASKTLRVGLLGAGMIGATHSAAYLNMPNVKLVGVWDVDPQRAERLAKPHGAKVFDDRAKLLKEIDAADICLPTTLHLENIKAAAAAGKGVICEKPLGRTLADCDAAIAACKKAKVPLLVGHVVRFFPEYRALRETILDGKIGEPAMLRLRRVVCAPGPRGAWYWDFAQSGGCVFDTAIHDLDWLLWTMGRPRTVYGIGRREADSLQDLALITMTWPEGAIAHLESSWCHDSFATSFEVAGSDGLVEYDMYDSAAVRVAPTGQAAAAGGKTVPESPLAKSPYQAELEHFVAVLRGESKPIITPEEAREAVELALVCLDAVRTRAVIELSAAKGGAKRAAAKKSAGKKKAALAPRHPE